MKTTTCSTTPGGVLHPAEAATRHLGSARPWRTIAQVVLSGLILTVAGIAGAANVPSGITGLWRFQSALTNGTATMAATIGLDMLNSTPPGNGGAGLGPWTDIGLDSWHTKFSDGGVAQDRSWDYLSVNPNFTPNGGGSYVNEYTIAIDYVQTSPGANGTSNSLFQTSWNGNATGGDLWIMWPPGSTYTNTTIGVDDVGSSIQTFDASKWHRIVWSVKNGDFFRVYVDGTLFLDGPGQPVDGRFSVYPDRFNLFADNNWRDAWGYVGTVMTWNRALTGAEVTALGGWNGVDASPTPLLFPDAPPELMSVSPVNGATNLAPVFNYQAVVLDLDGFVDTNSIQLLLDGAPVAPQVNRAGSISIRFATGGLLRSGSTHTYSLIMSASGVYSTNEVAFTVQQYTSYEWDFENADLTAALGNGVMAYADEFSTPGLTSFGTTDGGTVPHINGAPAKYMHVPAFQFDTDGYWLQFTDSGPNVGAQPYINKYTLLMDLMVPEPWLTTWIVPFFNTDPFNLNDADFYLKADGSIGIGYTGYSAPGAVTSNAWCRVGFVADLEANTLSYYVNGVRVKSGSGNGLGGRWALLSNQDVGPSPLYPANLLLFNEADPSGVWTHELYLNGVAFTDRALSSEEMAALGGPKASGILLGSFTPAPTLTSQLSGSNVVISWPSNYVGYALERKTDLGGTWAPAPGVTNNSVSLPIVPGSQFFRLVQ